jgi:hypothetical protein
MYSLENLIEMMRLAQSSQQYYQGYSGLTREPVMQRTRDSAMQRTRDATMQNKKSFMECVADRANHSEDKYTFNVDELTCFVTSSCKFNWNGYVVLPVNYKNLYRSLNQINSIHSVHNGISYFQDGVIGFTTAYSEGDYCLLREMSTGQPEHNCTYRSFQFVKEQTCQLARQIMAHIRIMETVIPISPLTDIFTKFYQMSSESKKSSPSPQTKMHSQNEKINEQVEYFNNVLQSITETFAKFSQIPAESKKPSPSSQAKDSTSFVQAKNYFTSPANQSQSNTTTQSNPYFGNFSFDFGTNANAKTNTTPFTFGPASKTDSATNTCSKNEDNKCCEKNIPKPFSFDFGTTQPKPQSNMQGDGSMISQLTNIFKTMGFNEVQFDNKCQTTDQQSEKNTVDKSVIDEEIFKIVDELMQETNVVMTNNESNAEKTDNLPNLIVSDSFDSNESSIECEYKDFSESTTGTGNTTESYDSDETITPISTPPPTPATNAIPSISTQKFEYNDVMIETDSEESDDW